MLWIGKSFTCRFQKHLPDGWETGSTPSRVRSAQERSGTMGRKLRDVSGDPRGIVNLQGFLLWCVIWFMLLDDLRIYLYRFNDVDWWWRMLIYATLPWILFWRYCVAFTLLVMCLGGSVTLLVWNIQEHWPFGRCKRVVHTVFHVRDPGTIQGTLPSLKLR